MTYEIPSQCALIKYVLECASDAGCCVKPPKTIGDTNDDTFLLAHACAFCGVCMVFASGGVSSPLDPFHCERVPIRKVGWLYMIVHYFIPT